MVSSHFSHPFFRNCILPSFTVKFFFTSNLPGQVKSLNSLLYPQGDVAEQLQAVLQDDRVGREEDLEELLPRRRRRPRPRSPPPS